MRENMTFLTNYYQIREMTIDRMKEIIDQNKRSKERTLHIKKCPFRHL